MLADFKGEINKTTTTRRDFTPHCHQWIVWKIYPNQQRHSDLTQHTRLMGLIYIYRTFHSKAANIHSSQVHVEHSQR